MPSKAALAAADEINIGLESVFEAIGETIGPDRTGVNQSVANIIDHHFQPYLDATTTLRRIIELGDDQAAATLAKQALERIYALEKIVDNI